MKSSQAAPLNYTSSIRHGMPIMRQRWEDLLFLHWRYDPSVLKDRIPEGLELDTFQGYTYLSIVAFRMAGVRPVIAPALPWLSYFNEFNMRLYVRDKVGTPGVYFISLDCDRRPAVWIARTLFGLPYMNASIDFLTPSRGKQLINQFKFVCKRDSEGEEGSYIWTANEHAYLARPGTLDFFLTERYCFFVEIAGLLRMGEVRHKPYKICNPEIAQWSSAPFIWNGLIPPKESPHLSHYSRGVDVTALALQTRN